jgi:hypothetical protein
MFSPLRHLWTAELRLLATTLTPLYNSSKGVTQTTIGPATSFSVPTVFNGQVYMGTKTEVDVFGLCSTLPSGQCKN